MTAYEKIYEQAADNYGYITTRDAADADDEDGEENEGANDDLIINP